MPFDKTLQSFVEHLQTASEKDDLILLLGAGKVNQIAAKLIKMSENVE